MSTFVLVHGAWHGGWCWKRVTPLLRQQGHAVYTPTLTGLGERTHLARPDIDLAVHTNDVVGLLEAEELKSVVLVGHSYAGMVVTGAAALAEGRVSRLVYLDAFVPEPGQALFDFIPEERMASMRSATKVHGEGWRVPPFPPERFGVLNMRDVAWLTRRLVPQPIRTFEQPVVSVPAPRLRRTYVYCSRPAMGTFDDTAKRTRGDRAWTFHELKTGHDAMITAPRDVARLLASR